MLNISINVTFPVDPSHSVAEGVNDTHCGTEQGDR